MTNSRDWERGGPKLDCRGVETTYHCNRKDIKLTIAVVALLAGALMLPNHDRWLVVTAGLEAATRGAWAEVASTVVLWDAVSTAGILAEAVTANEDLEAED